MLGAFYKLRRRKVCRLNAHWPQQMLKNGKATENHAV
jgi:hypothetical protein